MRLRITRIAAIALAIGFGAGAPAAAVTLKVSVTNNSTTGGLTLTPLLALFHNGTYDPFNLGGTASPGLEALAEDGITSTIDSQRAASNPGSTSAVVTAPQGFAGAPLIEPGETGSVLVNVDPTTQRFFSYLSMILPSNDQFIGNNNSRAHMLFNGAGAFMGPQSIIVTGLNAYDAGTEVNNGKGSAFAQIMPGMATTENGVITRAPGIDNFAGVMQPNGQVLDASKIGFANNRNFSIATISVAVVPVPAALPMMALGLAMLGGVAARRRRAAA